MKHIQIKFFLVTAVFLLSVTSCKKILQETPRSIFTPEFFKTERGVLGGITSQYAHLRLIFGQPYYYNSLETGTDEYTYGQSGDGNQKDLDFTGVGNLTAASGRSDVLWGVAFSNINTASGIIENGAAVGVSNALIAEARFFRAFDYFMLVQTFGGVPLDLGAGEMKFNSSPSRRSVRNTVPEVYTKGIFPDLKQAITDLPSVPRATGTVTKTVARLYLAKAYLTYAWWLQNPGNIPTYPASPRTDPDNHDAAYYFQQAYTLSLEGIDNAGATYGLTDTYYDIHVGGNDRNKEMLLYADHTDQSEFYNGSPLTGFQSDLGTDGRNTAVWFVTPNYTVLTSAVSSTGAGATVSPVQREAAQFFGRPFIRMAPPIGVFTNTFAEKLMDSRFDGTFTSTYRANWPKAYNPQSSAPAVLYNANDMSVAPGDAILTFLGTDAEAVGLAYPVPVGPRFPGKVANSVGAGQMPGRSDFVVAPSGISRIIFPGLWKMGVYRVGNVGFGEPNAPSTRPFKIARFSEFYLIAAEAAVKGAATVAGRTARDLVNVLRSRAGKWKFSNRANAVLVADFSATVSAATPANIDINYILAERSREYFGEGYRWFDLVRTQKLNDLAGSYQICAATYGDHTPVTFNRTIQTFHYLRPIPQGQLDGMDMTAAEKAAYQNPNYQ